MIEYLSPNDEKYIGKTDSESIQNAINATEQTGIRTVCIPRICKRTGRPEWIIDKTILLPSDITIILDDCALDFRRVRENDYFKNVVFKDVFAKNGSHICITCDQIKPDIRN